MSTEAIMTLLAFPIDNMTFYLHFCTDASLQSKDGNLFPPKRPRALAENAFSKVRNRKQGHIKKRDVRMSGLGCERNQIIKERDKTPTCNGIIGVNTVSGVTDLL